MKTISNWQPKFQPRRWQLDALELWKQDFQGVVKVVTGGGKTIFAQMCLLVFKEQYPNGCILIIVPTITLLDQWYVSLQEDLGVLPDHIACFSGEEKPKSSKPINLIVINTNIYANYEVEAGSKTG